MYDTGWDDWIWSKFGPDSWDYKLIVNFLCWREIHKTMKLIHRQICVSDEIGQF
jgi:hypothetical protein